MFMRRSLLIGLVVFSLAALLVVGGTMAFFTDNEKVENTLTAGTVEVEINEHGFKDITNWQRGGTENKDVSVKSTGSKGTYVRVCLVPQWLNEAGTDVDTNLSVGNVILNLASNWGNNWVYADGWYYYKQKLDKNGETSLLLDSVTLDSSTTGEEYSGRTLRIKVIAEGVQASHDAYKRVWGIDDLPW
jgi:predicted ribosomally synthesized peptide with SipW-like signal peptide